MAATGMELLMPGTLSIHSFFYGKTRITMVSPNLVSSTTSRNLASPGSPSITSYRCGPISTAIASVTGQ
jgi:hypothetical protein